MIAKNIEITVYFRTLQFVYIFRLDLDLHCFFLQGHLLYIPFRFLGVPGAGNRCSGTTSRKTGTINRVHTFVQLPTGIQTLLRVDPHVYLLILLGYLLQLVLADVEIGI